MGVGGWRWGSWAGQSALLRCRPPLLGERGQRLADGLPGVGMVRRGPEIVSAGWRVSTPVVAGWAGAAGIRLRSVPVDGSGSRSPARARGCARSNSVGNVFRSVPGPALFRPVAGNSARRGIGTGSNRCPGCRSRSHARGRNSQICRIHGWGSASSAPFRGVVVRSACLVCSAVRGPRVLPRAGRTMGSRSWRLASGGACRRRGHTSPHHRP